MMKTVQAAFHLGILQLYVFHLFLVIPLFLLLILKLLKIIYNHIFNWFRNFKCKFGTYQEFNMIVCLSVCL